MDQEKDQYILLEELLTDAYLIHDYQDISYWKKEHIVAAIEDLSKFHALYFSNENKLAALSWLGFIPTANKMTELLPLWRAYAEDLRSFEGTLFAVEDIKFYFNLLDTLPSWWKEIDAMPKTCIYNDLQIRNMAMRNKGDIKLCLFDWEVSTIQSLPRSSVNEPHIFLEWILLY